MTAMKIKRQIIRKFKGLEEFVFEPQGANADIFGDNGTGKTTIADAHSWLLTDKDTQNKNNFAIKTLDQDGNEIHGLEHDVEELFSVGSREISFRKVYHEVWEKKRGSASPVFSGHTTDHFIDGVPVKKNEFVTRIKLIAEEDLFKLLTSPTYFNEQLNWQQRREILLKVCGDISDVDVIASNKSLESLPGILAGRTLEDYRKIIAARRTKINDELKKIPIRIDEVTKGLPDLAGLDAEQIAAEIESLKEQIKAKEQEIARIESGSEIAEKHNQIRTVEGELITLKNQIQGKISEQIDAKRRELQQIKSLLFDAQSAAKNKQDTLVNNQRKIKQFEAEMEELRNKWHQANEQQFSFQQESTCPTCGQALPEDQLQAAREKAQADFNRSKSDSLEIITSRGKEGRERVEAFQIENQKLSEEIQGANSVSADFAAKVSDLNVIIENMMKDAEVYKEDPAYVSKLGEKQALEDQIKQLQQDNTEAIGAVKKDIESLGGTLLDLQTSLAKVDQYKKGQERIQALSDQERNLAAEYEKLEGELYLTEQFIRTKVNLLEERINSKFQLARFKLFDTQVNGGVVECCETTFQGVPYGSGLNNAARINVGLDIINTLSDFYKFDAPIFIDNAEAVTSLIPTKGQQIRLVVSEKDKQLRVETEGQGYLFEDKEAV